MTIDDRCLIVFLKKNIFQSLSSSTSKTKYNEIIKTQISTIFLLLETGAIRIFRKNETKRNFFNVFVCSSLARACNIFILTLKLHFPHKKSSQFEKKKRNKKSKPNHFEHLIPCQAFSFYRNVLRRLCKFIQIVFFSHFFLLLFRFDPFFFFLRFLALSQQNWKLVDSLFINYLSLRTSIDIVILPNRSDDVHISDILCSIIQLLWYSKAL